MKCPAGFRPPAGSRSNASIEVSENRQTTVARTLLVLVAPGIASNKGIATNGAIGRTQIVFF